MILVGLIIISLVFVGLSIAGANYGNDGPADNYGDGVSDGSGYDSPNGPNGDIESDIGNGEPAPNSGDGISDGSGW